MIIQQIISQNKSSVNYTDEPTITFSAATSGNYTTLSDVSTVDIFTPITTGVNTYNHHPKCIEYYGAIHVMFSTHNQDEEGCGQYVRYSKSTDNGVTWTTPVTLFESQDDITNSYVTNSGRVCICSGFAIYNDELYAVVDVNDRSSENESNPRTRTKVGVLARKINSNATFDTVYWIENADGSYTAPSEIPTYPTYAFNSTIREGIRSYFLKNVNYKPTWYYSAQDTDILYTRGLYGSDELTEPSSTILPNGQLLTLWRALTTYTNIKIAQTGTNILDLKDTYESTIPDFPSVTKILTLNNRNVIVIGNNASTYRSPLFLAVSSDGFNYASADTYNIDTSTATATFSGNGKGRGCQYPDAIQISNGKIFCVYSVTKEDIRCAIFDAPELN